MSRNKLILSVGAVLGMATLCGYGQTDPRTTALAAWYLGDGIAGETNPITSTGFITYNVVPSGRGARPDKYAAQLVTPSYFGAGTGLGVSNNQITVFLRARIPNGAWNYGLLAKRGSLSTLNYNLFSVDLAGTPGYDIGFELRTTNAFVQVSFPVSRIDATAWHNLIGRYDGTNVQLFCDDRLMASAPLSGSLALNNEPTLIGAETDNGSIVRRFTGYIEEAAIWDTALTDAQIAHLNNLTVPHADFPTNPLHYKHPNHPVGDVHVSHGGGGVWALTYQYNTNGNWYQAQLLTSDFLNFNWRDPVHAPVSYPNVLPTWFAIESVWDPFLLRWRSIWGYGGMRSSLSDDRFNWYAPSPQLVLPTPGGYDRFSDPSITQVGSNAWQMAITMEKQNLPSTQHGSIGWASSSNLTQWTFMGDLFFPGDRGVPEVPSLFQMGSKWYLLASWKYMGGVGRPTYQVADSPTGPWSEFTPNSLDGKDVCAATSGSDGSRRILLGWLPLNAWNPPNNSQHWGGHLCFPREVFPVASGALRSRLPEQFSERIRGPQLFPGLATPSTKSGSWTYQGTNISCLSTSGQNRSILPGLYDRFDADMTFINLTGTSRVGWLIDWQESGTFFEAGLDQVSQSLFIRVAGGAIYADLSVPVTLHDPHRLRLIVEQDLVEVVYDDQFTLAARIPTKLLTTSLGLFTDGGPVNFPSVSVYRLNNLEAIPPSVVRVPEDAPTIQAALNAADPMTQIQVASGIYDEADILTISKPVTFLATGGPVTLRVPSDEAAVVDVAGGVTGVKFEGFRFERAVATSSSAPVIQLQRASETEFINCAFTGPGAGVGVRMLYGADAAFDGCSFSNFNAGASGLPAVLLEGHDSSSPFSDLTIRDSYFGSGCNRWIRTLESSNWPRVGGITVSNCVFSAAREAHGMKFRDNGTLTMQFDPAKPMVFQDCVFEGTQLELAEFHYTSGGAPLALTFSRCHFKAYNSTRRMMWLDLPTPIKFENCLFAGGKHENILTVWGGPPSVDLHHCTMINDGITAAEGAAGGIAQSTFIWGWDSGRTFNILNCLFRCPVNYSAGFACDATSPANRNYAVSYSVIDHPIPVGTKAQISPGPGYSTTSLAPAFVSEANRNYHLWNGVPWVGGGTGLGYALDLDKRARNQDGAPDMGAYEFSSAFPPVPAISIAKGSNHVVVTFDGVLQAAEHASGPYSDVVATSPLMSPVLNGTRFWRARSP